jgi:hypothetical protein
VAFDVKIKVALVEQERRAFAILNDRQSTFPGQAAQLPRWPPAPLGLVELTVPRPRRGPKLVIY